MKLETIYCRWRTRPISECPPSRQIFFRDRFFNKICTFLRLRCASMHNIFSISEFDVIWIGKEITCGKVEESSRSVSSTTIGSKVPNIGFEFEVATFERAACVGVGSWTSEASWYPGYLWKACVCPKCRWEYKTKMKIWVVQTKTRSRWTEWFKLKPDWKLFLEQIYAKKVFDTLHVCYKFQTKIVIIVSHKIMLLIVSRSFSNPCLNRKFGFCGILALQTISNCKRSFDANYKGASLLIMFNNFHKGDN